MYASWKFSISPSDYCSTTLQMVTSNGHSKAASSESCFCCSSAAVTSFKEASLALVAFSWKRWKPTMGGTRGHVKLHKERGNNYLVPLWWIVVSWSKGCVYFKCCMTCKRLAWVLKENWTGKKTHPVKQNITTCDHDIPPRWFTCKTTAYETHLRLRRSSERIICAWPRRCNKDHNWKHKN